jgi:hypothetical protein
MTSSEVAQHRMEPSRQMTRAIMSVRRAAHSERWADSTINFGSSSTQDAASDGRWQR